MHWVVFAVRLLLVIAASGLVLAAPRTSGWQLLAGFFYPIGVLVFLNLLDRELDIVDVALWGMAGRKDSPLTPKSLLGRAFAVIAFWFVVLTLGLLINVVPIADVFGWSEHSGGPSTAAYFMAGTLVGAVVYLAAVGWYRKSMRRRYGY